MLYLIIAGPLIGFAVSAFLMMWWRMILDGEGFIVATISMLFFQSPFIAIFYYLYLDYQDYGNAEPFVIILVWTIILTLYGAIQFLTKDS